MRIMKYYQLFSILSKRPLIITSYMYVSWWEISVKRFSTIGLWGSGVSSARVRITSLAKYSHVLLRMGVILFNFPTGLYVGCVWYDWSWGPMCGSLSWFPCLTNIAVCPILPLVLLRLYYRAAFQPLSGISYSAYLYSFV